MRALLAPRIAAGGGAFFAQGMSVVPNPRDPAAFPQLVSYCGGAFCSFTCNLLATAPGGRVQEMVSAWTNHEYYNLSAALYEGFPHRNDYAVPLGPLADPGDPWFQFAPQANGLGQYRTGIAWMSQLVQQLLRKFRPTALLSDGEVARLGATAAEASQHALLQQV